VPNAFIKRIGQQVTNFEDAVDRVSTKDAAHKLASKADSLFRELRAFIKEMHDELAVLEDDLRNTGEDEETAREDIQDDIDFKRQDIDDAVSIKDDMNDIARKLMETVKQFNRMKK
jgi:hypothetical protein